MNSGLLNRLKHEEYPGPPFPLFCDIPEQTVIVVLVFDDVLAQIQHRGIEQILEDQIEYVQNPACPPIAVSEWVNGLELVMNQSELYEGVDRIILMDVFFKVFQLIPDNRFSLRRGVYITSPVVMFLIAVPGIFLIPA